jgi:cytochrome c2
MSSRAHRGVVGIVLTLLVSAACTDATDREVVRAITGGWPERGRRSLEQYGCGSCHEIPGVARARGRVGPPLEGIALRGYLAGRLTNEPKNLVRWIRHPREVDPATAMPELGVSEPDARDMAAYLYTR